MDFEVQSKYCFLPINKGRNFVSREMQMGVQKVVGVKVLIQREKDLRSTNCFSFTICSEKVYEMNIKDRNSSNNFYSENGVFSILRRPGTPPTSIPGRGFESTRHDVRFQPSLGNSQLSNSNTYQTNILLLNMWFLVLTVSLSLLNNNNNNISLHILCG